MPASRIVTFKLEDLPPLTCEEAELIWQNAKDPIDYSDCPEITDEDFKNGKLVLINREQSPLSLLP